MDSCMLPRGFDEQRANASRGEAFPLMQENLAALWGKSPLLFRLLNRGNGASLPSGRVIKLRDPKNSPLFFRLLNRGTPGAMVALVDRGRRQRIAQLKGAAA